MSTQLALPLLLYEGLLLLWILHTSFYSKCSVFLSVWGTSSLTATLRLWILRRQQAEEPALFSSLLPAHSLPLTSCCCCCWLCQKLCHREFCEASRRWRRRRRSDDASAATAAVAFVLSPHAKMRPGVCVCVCMCMRVYVCINETQFQLFTLFMWKSCQQPETELESAERAREREANKLCTLWKMCWQNMRAHWKPLWECRVFQKPA